MLQDFQRTEDITPDRFFDNMDTLRAAISRQTSPTARAVYQATMAHLLAISADLADAGERQTESPDDSIREWNSDEYMRHACLLYKEALGDMEALHQAKTEQWIPLVRQGRDEKIYANDMLAVVWRAMTNDIGQWLREKEQMPTTDNLATFYRLHGLREAALHILLEGLWDSWDPSVKDRLMALKQEYSNTEAGALVHLCLASERMNRWGMGINDRLAILDEADRKWPDNRWKNNIENLRRQLTAPVMQARYPEQAYPLSTQKVPIKTRNVSGFVLSTYQLPSDFLEGDKQERNHMTGDELLKLVRKEGRQIRHTAMQPRGGSNGGKVCWDTLDWHTPDCGLYAVVIEASTKAQLAKNPEPEVGLVRISRLATFMRYMGDKQARLTVVDYQKGQPLPGVKVEVFRKSPKEDSFTLLKTLLTDEKGAVLIDRQEGNNLYIKVSRAGDEATGRRRLDIYYSDERLTDREEQHIAISTDRSIYRPGQKIMMSAVVYKQKEWDAKVKANEEYEVVLRGANGRKLCTHTCRTDDMGVLADTLPIPETGLPGNYNIYIEDACKAVKVEEYVRPTFHVELSQPKDATARTDSVAFEGKVTTYSGVPVTHARITGTAVWGSSWWWRNRSSETRIVLDTLRTDQEGKFTYQLATNGTAEQLKRGRRLEVSIDALSAQGETQQGALDIAVCSTPLRMNGMVPRHICKEYPKPLSLRLYSSTDQPVKGSITCTLSQAGKEKRTFTMQAGESAFPQEMKDLESGRYQLEARADINGDTASWRSDLTLTSLSDNKLPFEANLYLDCPQSDFSEQEPAKVQIGTSLPDAWIHMTLETKDTTALDTIFHLGDSCLTYTIPYRKEYGKGARLFAYMFCQGKLHTRDTDLHLVQPDSRLRLQWESFRDHLRPGQQEEWTLSVKRPDGKPAQANLAATLYDASLDALARHSFDLSVYRGCRLPYIGIHTTSLSAYDKYNLNMGFTPKLKKEYTPDFSTFDIDRFYLALPKPMQEASMHVRSESTRGLREVKATAKRNAKREYMGMAQTAERGLGHIAGMSLNEVALSDMAVMEKAEESVEAAEETANLRTDLQETAFFMPRLRTDSQGQVKISFTLPESMTSWHLLGAAHTTDMMVGLLDTMVVAEKELMAEMLLPRFVRSGDHAVLTASIRNRSEKQQKGQATLLVSDTETDKVLMRKAVRFQLGAQEDTTFFFPYTGSMDHPALTVKWVAQGQDYSDGEQRYLPVLSDMQSITETKAFSLSGKGTHTISLDKLFAHDSKEAVNRSLTIEYTRDPKWLAIQTLPSMAYPKCRDVLSLTAAFYSGALAYSIGHRYPQVREAIQEWNRKDTAALESPLMRNQQLADMLLQETPWVMEANQEKARRQRLTSLFDDVAQLDYRMSMLNALDNLQRYDGSFSWFPGMSGSTYLTGHVANMLTRLNTLTLDELPRQREIREKACRFLLKEMVKDVSLLKKSSKPTVSASAMRTLYALRKSDCYTSMKAEEKQAVSYMLQLLKKQAGETDRVERAQAAMVLHLYGEEKLAQSLMERLHVLLKQPDGMHLAYRSNIRMGMDQKTSEHVQLMEAIRTIEPHDTATLNAMTEWLIGMKRTREWDSAPQTADAVFALLSGSPDLCMGADKLTLKTSSKSFTISSPETTLGYVRERTDLISKPKKLVVEKESRQLSYGAVYAQYQIPVLQTEQQQEGLNIRRDITHVEHLATGDRVHIRYTLTADRDYEFVRLMAPRIAAAEPSAQRSGYEFNGSTSYYKAIHDASTEYFLDRLPRGTWVIEEDWLISRAGSYCLPAALLQCLYAPDFQAHTTGTAIEVRQK